MADGRCSTWVNLPGPCTPSHRRRMVRRRWDERDRAGSPYLPARVFATVVTTESAGASPSSAAWSAGGKYADTAVVPGMGGQARFALAAPCIETWKYWLSAKAGSG